MATANFINPRKAIFPELPFYEDIPAAVYPPGKHFLLCAKGSGSRPQGRHKTKFEFGI
jgi:hypothetical protein